MQKAPLNVKDPFPDVLHDTPFRCKKTEAITDCKRFGLVWRGGV